MAEADVFDIEIQNNDAAAVGKQKKKNNSDSDEEPLEIQEVKHESAQVYRLTITTKQMLPRFPFYHINLSPE